MGGWAVGWLSRRGRQRHAGDKVGRLAPTHAHMHPTHPSHTLNKDTHVTPPPFCSHFSGRVTTTWSPRSPTWGTVRVWTGVDDGGRAGQRGWGRVPGAGTAAGVRATRVDGRVDGFVDGCGRWRLKGVRWLYCLYPRGTHACIPLLPRPAWDRRAHGCVARLHCAPGSVATGSPDTPHLLALDLPVCPRHTHLLPPFDATQRRRRQTSALWRGGTAGTPRPRRQPRWSGGRGTTGGARGGRTARWAPSPDWDPDLDLNPGCRP